MSRGRLIFGHRERRRRLYSTAIREAANHVVGRRAEAVAVQAESTPAPPIQCGASTNSPLDDWIVLHVDSFRIATSDGARAAREQRELFR